MIFLSKSELRDLLLKNTKYYNSFTKLDMIARKINSLSEYFSIISQDCSEFNPQQKQILKESSVKADKILSHISLPGFDGRKASRMRWKIGCMSGERYEGGYPHTIKGTIILFQDFNNLKLVKLLIHEKIHIYQRKYKKDIKLYLKHNKFTPIYLRKNKSNIRANPDLDGITYYNKKNGIIYESNYRTCRPRSIADITNKRHEHPYEEMAYSIEKMA